MMILVSSVIDSCISWAQKNVNENFNHDLSIGWQGGVLLANYTFVLTILLELISTRTVRRLLSLQPKQEYRSLYVAAWLYNLRNHYFLGIPVYAMEVALFAPPCCDGDDDDSESNNNTSNIQYSLLNVLGVLLIHSLCCYFAHRMLHHPRLHCYHRFHHRFNTCIPPSSANAVTIVEYLIAYVVPFGICALLVRPDEAELRYGVYVVTTCNLLIHTPCLETFSEHHMSKIFSSAYLHAEHHRKLTINYAAPTINIDWFATKLEDAIFSFYKRSETTRNKRR